MQRHTHGDDIAGVRLSCLDGGVCVAFATPVNNVCDRSFISVSQFQYFKKSKTKKKVLTGNLFVHSVELSHQIVVSIVELASD